MSECVQCPSVETQSACAAAAAAASASACRPNCGVGRAAANRCRTRLGTRMPLRLRLVVTAPVRPLEAATGAARWPERVGAGSHFGVAS